MAYLSSPPRIYNKALKWKGMAKEISDKDIITKLSVIEGPIYYWDANREILARHNHKYNMVHHTPWIHQKSSVYKRCGFDHNICFNYFGIIPHRCLECWKVVVFPRTLKELFELTEFQFGCGRPCKCGIDVRSYTSKLYSGYFYNNSVEEGMECYHWLRKEMTDLFDEDFLVIYKRGCTEFELTFGPSNQWVIPEGQLDLEAEIFKLFNRYVTHNPPKQPSVMLPSIKLRWIQWAWQNADDTYKLYTNGEPLHRPPYTYQHLDLTKLEKKVVEMHRIE